MATAIESSANPILGYQADILGRPSTPMRRMADAIRALAFDAADRAGSAEQRLTLDLADVATALWTRFHKFDAADPRWPDRDRFVLSAAQGSMLLYALIHLSGHQGLPIDAIRDVGQFHSPAAGHPEYGFHPAIETTTGPLGQGLATAVGMAIAERNMAARFGKSLVDHRTWVIASDYDMMGGISHEAAAVAGHLGLAKLTVLYHDASRSSSEETLKHFAACGWATRRVDGRDLAEINAALSSTVRSKKPTLIACRTNVEDNANRNPANGVHAPVPGTRGAGSPPGWDASPFDTHDDLRQRWHAAGSRGAAARRSWLKRLARHSQRGEFERVTAGRLPDNWHEAVAELKQHIANARPKRASHASSQTCQDALLPAIPELLGGSSGLTALGNVFASMSAGNYGGRHVDYGVRAHAMAEAANGLALHGGIVPYVGTFVAFSDYLRPAMRLCAMMRQRVVYVLTDGSTQPGEDAPVRPPVEHLASLRAMPNLHVFRPADAMETAECWELALRRADGPSLLALSHQALPPWRTDTWENRSARGGYVLAEAEGPRQATIIATGSEVSTAMAAREKLAADNIAVAVVSLPCWELFTGQDATYRAQVLGGAPRVGIEAACGFGWEQWLGPEDSFIGMNGSATGMHGSGIGLNGFGASASRPDLNAHPGITPEAVVAAVTRRIG